MLTMRICIQSMLFFLCASVLGSCKAEAVSVTTMYVLASKMSASRFNTDLATIAQRHGLKPSVGQSTDDRGHTFHVVEASGWRVRVWSQNMPLSGHEDLALCGNHPEPYPDPGQYIVRLSPTIWIFGEAASVNLAALFRDELSQLGYEIRESVAPCSPLAKTVL